MYIDLTRFISRLITRVLSSYAVLSCLLNMFTFIPFYVIIFYFQVHTFFLTIFTFTYFLFSLPLNYSGLTVAIVGPARDWLT
jgi:hypothetical protein